MIRLATVGLRAPGSSSVPEPTGARDPTSDPDPTGDRSSQRQMLLEAIDLEIHAGESVAMVGPNGAGKSLLLQVMAGLRAPTTGHVHREPDNLRVALVFQAPDDQIVGSTVERDLAFGLENLAVSPDEMRPRVEEMLVRIDLADRRHHAPHLLSEGEKQRLALGAALVMEPSLLLLDEPTSRLDADGRRRFQDLVRHARQETDLAIVHVTHRSEEALPADRIVGLRAGRIVFDDTSAALMRSPLAGELGMRWSHLHQFRQALSDHGVHVAPAAGDWWNDAEVLLDQLGVAGTEA